MTKYADYKSLSSLKLATLSATGGISSCKPPEGESMVHEVVLENKSPVPAFFIRLNLVDGSGEDVNPVLWSDNYVTLWPNETLTLEVADNGTGKAVQISGGNVKAQIIQL